MTKEASALLDLIIEKAPKLRGAGVRGRVSVPGASFSIGEPDVVAGDDDKSDEEEDDLNPLADPTTFGMRQKKGRTAPSLKGGS